MSDQQQPPPPSEEQEQEELDFLFDEEMEQLQGCKNKLTDWSDSDSDYEIDDQDVNKILIVTQTPPYLRKHCGEDRTGNHVCHAKITSELAKVINDGLYYYEQDLWMEQSENDTTMKVIFFIFDLGPWSLRLSNLWKEMGGSVFKYTEQLWKYRQVEL